MVVCLVSIQRGVWLFAQIGQLRCSRLGKEGGEGDLGACIYRVHLATRFH